VVAAVVLAAVMTDPARACQPAASRLSAAALHRIEGNAVAGEDAEARP
jgi:hypothetical protein